MLEIHNVSGMGNGGNFSLRKAKIIIGTDVDRYKFNVF